MSTINYTYNVIVDRFRQFAAGHFQLRRFTHGEISQADLEKEAEWPWLHVKPRAINYSPGTRSFSFEIFISDLPRDKEDKTGYQAESITDCSLIFQDLINEIYLGNMFGSDVVLTRPVNAEPFVEQYTHTLTGVTGTIELNLDYDWSACSIPASWNYNTPTDSPSDGWGALQFIESLDQNGVFVSLVNDVEAPGNSYYYGTDAEGVKGWYATEAGGLTCEDLPECAVIISITDDIAALQADMLLKANSADLGATAFSNSYNDLDNKPTIPAAQVNSDWNATSGVAEILNKPSLPATVGDMLKSVYDTDVDGVVDSAERIQIVVRNSTGSTLTKGQIVYLSGATGNRPNAVLAQANTEATSSKTIGMVIADIANNADGQVAVNGTLHDLDTSAFTEGDTLWLSATTAGGMVANTPPSEPNHTVFIGYVARSHLNQGRVVLAIQNGYELDELHGVLITTPANNEVLTYESSTSLWKNKTIASALGYTPENAANKQNSLAVDGTGVKFPTVDAVNTQSMIDKGKRMVSFFTDFYGNDLSRDGLVSATSGGIITPSSLTIVPNRTNQQGVHIYSTATATTNWANHVSSGVVSMYLGNGINNFETSININNLSDVTNRFRTIHGYSSASGAAVETDGVFFTYDEGGTQNGTAASPNWQCVTVANSVRTLTTTSTAVTTGAWHKLRIEINAAGTSVAFYLNGTLLATHTTNIPLGSASRFIVVKQGIYKTAGTTARLIYTDYLGYENIQTTPRT